MKKRIVSVLLAAAMVSASVLPAFGAEFTDGAPVQEETVNLFEDSEAAFSYDEEYDEEDAYWTPVSIKITSGKKRTEYWWPIGWSTAMYMRIMDGIKAEITYVDGHKTTVEFDSDGTARDGMNVFKGKLDYDEDRYGDDIDLPAGDYPFRIVCKGLGNAESDVIMLHVKDMHELPMLEKTENGKASITGRTLERKIYFRMVAEKDGNIMISDSLNGNAGYDEFTFWKEDCSFADILDDKCTVVRVEKGETYYVGVGVLDRNTTNMDQEVTVTVTYADEIKSVKVAREPMDNRIWEPYSADLKGLRFEVTYEDGTTETIDPFRVDGMPYVTSRGDGVTRYFDGNPEKENATKDTRTVTYVLGGQEFTYDVKYTDPSDILPILENEGSIQGYTNAYGLTYILFRTGEATDYIFNNSKNEEMSIDTVSGEGVHYAYNDTKVSGLKPNTTYMIRSIPDYERNLNGAVFTVKSVGKSKTPLSKCTVKLASSSMEYTGKSLKPAVTVKNGSTKLKAGTDYTVSYSANKNLGTATVTVKGKGSYTGTVTKNFKIVLGKPVLKSAKSSKARTAVIKWDKVPAATSYTVYVKTGSKWTKLGTTTKNSFTHSGATKAYPAKSKKTYTYTVKAYRKAGSKTYTSSYDSKGIKVKVK